MKPKRLTMFGMIVGSTLGSYLPVLWGGSWLSLWSVVLGVLGGLAGIWAGWQISHQ